MDTSFISYLLATLTLISHIGIIFGLVYFYIFKDKKEDVFIDFITRNNVLLGLLVSIVATLGSLFYSEIVGFDPCKLCWYQRIFMYPQVILLGIALYKKQATIIPYSIALAIIGGVIALYHNYIYFKRTSSAFCTAEISCIKRYVFEFGYITIPVMSITAFVLLILLLSITLKKAK